ncbi:MAG: DEAD/DEAH box helicase [Labilithrix sp.]|nr:DEAD/DEAH box helicase [Labilithrix sp.]MCW5811533.1 DEAD/DEAH box helicase [Labilithrix sp.]
MNGDKGDRVAITGILREELGVPLRLSADGVVVAASEAHRLLTVRRLDLDWTEAAFRFASNRDRARRHHDLVHTLVEEIKRGGAQKARSYLPDLDDAGRLDEHQLVNVAAMTVPDGPGLCVFDEQGAGKTVTFIFAFDLLAKRHQADLALIVAPKSMVAEWPRDIARFKQDLYKTGVLAGARRDKVTAIRNGADIFVTNFETVVSMEQELTALLRARDGRAVLAIDESFYVKNLDARRTRALRRLREWCGRAYVLCGTPAPNAPQDLIQQFNIVDFGITFDNVALPDDRAAAAPIVQNAIDTRGLSIRHLKQDVLPDLPAKSFSRVLVPLQPIQQRLYQGALRKLIVDLRAADDASFNRELTSFLARRMALLQICSDPSMVNDAYDETPAKLLALDTIVREFVEKRREKVIVWSFFRHTVDSIVRRFADLGAVRYDGSVASVDERRDAVRNFQEDDVTQVFVANPAAAGAGLTLHRSRVAIYESMSNQAAHYLQSLDRIHRRGQEREVEYIVLLGDGTIELNEYDRLLTKERTAQALLGDQVQPAVTRESMLSDLQAAANLVGLENPT